MSDEQFKKSVWERIHRAQDECAELTDQFDKLNAEIQQLAAEKTALEVKIANWQELVTDAEQNESGTSDAVGESKTNPTRRMRLGSKKRVIYQMVADGLHSLSALDDTLRHFDRDIDARYVREVIRNGMGEGDFAGNLEGEFSVTEGGKGILAKAPKPRDWMDWQNALNKARFDKSNEDYR